MSQNPLVENLSCKQTRTRYDLEFEAAISCVSRYKGKMPAAPDVRWHQRLQSFNKAFARLSDGARLASERELSPLEKQGVGQRLKNEK